LPSSKTQHAGAAKVTMFAKRRCDLRNRVAL
jgi:hypothetical protein